MLRDDGVLIAEQGFWNRVQTMRLVAYVGCSPESRKLFNFRWSRFIWIAFQYIFIGQYQAMSKEDMKDFLPKEESNGNA